MAEARSAEVVYVNAYIILCHGPRQHQRTSINVHQRISASTFNSLAGFMRLDFSGRYTSAWSRTPSRALFLDGSLALRLASCSYLRRLSPGLFSLTQTT